MQPVNYSLKHPFSGSGKKEVNVIFAITYDLNKQGQDYLELYSAIESLGEAIHPLQNLWFVASFLSASKVRAVLKDAIDINDSVFVIQVTSGSWDCYMSSEAIRWLQHRV